MAEAELVRPVSPVRRSFPDALEQTVPGMPAGSPGMEGGTHRAYDVLMFGADGQKPFMRFLGTEIAS